MIRFLVFISLISFNFNLDAQKLLIDGLPGLPFEWTDEDILAEDLNDNPGLEITQLWTKYDDDYLYIRFDVNEEIIIQRLSSFVVIIDADNDANTGFPIKGLGTELSFYFNNNNGFINTSNNTFNINHDDIGFFVAPAYESSSFEIAIRRDLGNYGVSIGDQIKLAVFEDISNGDIAPNNPQNISLELSPKQAPDQQYYTIERADCTDFRILNFNVLFDQIFEAESFDAYDRVLKAIDPDIIAFQEIYDHSSLQTRSLVEQFLPSDPGEQWFHAKVGADIIVISRYPIVFDDWVDGNGAFVIEIDGKEILLFNVHFPCCDNDFGRDQEIDALLAYIRDIINGTGPYDLDESTPFFIVGDYNLVGSGDQLNNLLSGNITNNTFYGPDFNPDWNIGNLYDLAPPVAGSNLAYTWYNASSSFTPGRLDFVLSSPSNSYNLNQFVLDTRLLDPTELFLNNLSQSDSGDCSDHLPVVSDWSFDKIIDSVNDLEDRPSFNIYPNPAGSEINIRVANNFEAVYLTVFDELGNSLIKKRVTGLDNYKLDLSSLRSGIHFIQIQSMTEIRTKKFIKH